LAASSVRYHAHAEDQKRDRDLHSRQLSAVVGGQRIPYALPDAGWGWIDGVGTASLSTRLCAIALGVALVFAQLLCGAHKAEALGHKPGGVCDICLSLATVDHALVDVGTPPPVHSWPALDHRPDARVVRAIPVRELHARSPPSIETDSARLVN
jgi:hypothetical protein